MQELSDVVIQVSTRRRRAPLWMENETQMGFQGTSTECKYSVRERPASMIDSAS